ncbi:MAG: hypothetical protein ACYC9Y_11915 [Candidatus Methylomirabilia bacterium]
MIKNGRFAALAMALPALTVLLAGGASAQAQSPEPAVAPGVLLRIEARFVDRASGTEAGWGATGQILVPSQPGDPALLRWRQARAVATSLSRQSVTLALGGRGLIRVGREVPFAGWFQRHGVRCGWLEAGAEWREVESALEVGALSQAADGAVRLEIAPEFSYLAGRARRSVAFPDERTEIVVTPGAEVRFVPPAALAAFYNRLLAGYDPLRRVWPVDLILRADLVDDPEP